MQSKITAQQIKATPFAKALRHHIEANKSGLVGAQWVVMEVIDLRDSPITAAIVTKVIGTDNGKYVSGPLDFFKEKQFCGIVYHHERWCEESSTKDSITQLTKSSLHGNLFVFFNPYQNKVKFIDQ